MLITNFFAGSVSVLDTGTNTITDCIYLGPQAGGANGIALSPEGKTAYVANFFTANVSVVDLVAKAVAATIAVGSGPNSVVMAPDGNTVYVTNFFSDTVSVIDTGSRMVKATIPVGSFPRGAAIIFHGMRLGRE